MALKRRLVELDRDNRAFWTGGRNGDLLIIRCRHCRIYLHPPLPRCPACESSEVFPEKVSGKGRVHGFTVNYRAWVSGQDVPYVVALVELDEQNGLFLPTNIVGCAPRDVFIGMEVEVLFEQVDDQFVPLFRPIQP